MTGRFIKYSRFTTEFQDVNLKQLTTDNVAALLLKNGCQNQLMFAKMFCVQEKQAARAEAEDGEEDDESAQQAQETLDLLNESKQENNGRFDY